MLKQWLSRLETVHKVETREEREAVYRFRYSVYFEEFGRELGSPDHVRKWVTDDDDEKATTTILYTGSVENMTGTVRIRHWRAGEVPHHDFEELSMDRFPDIAERNVSEIGRLMVKPSMRGKLVLASLLRVSYEILAGEEESDLCFCYCSPGMVRLYERLAMRPYGGRLIHAPDGLMVPMVAVMSDRDYFKSTGSFFAPLVRRFFGPKKRPAVDLEPYRGIFALGATGIELSAERVRRQVEEVLPPGTCSRARSFLDTLPADSLSDVVGRGIVVDVEDGTLVTRKGFREQEIYFVLEGEFEATDDGRFVGRLDQGDVFGEDAFLRPDGRRRASVHAVGSGRVLVLRGRSLEKLVEHQPVLAEPVLEAFGRVLHADSLSAA